MSATHIALLRGINVGKAKRISMADLRTLFEKLGFTDVKTLLNSGNVVFSSGAAVTASDIEAAMTKKLGVSARVTVITAKELIRIVRSNSLVDRADDPSHLLVAVFNKPADQKRAEPLVKKNWSPEAFALGPRAAYLWCVPNVVDSPLGKAFARAAGDAATSRNWTTMLKLQALVETV
ncbi:MAG: DUF1697 domain-containing protein [Gemmataceae bacterium]